MWLRHWGWERDVKHERKNWRLGDVLFSVEEMLWEQTKKCSVSECDQEELQVACNFEGLCTNLAVWPRKGPRVLESRNNEVPRPFLALINAGSGFIWLCDVRLSVRFVCLDILHFWIFHTILEYIVSICWKKNIATNHALPFHCPHKAMAARRHIPVKSRV